MESHRSVSINTRRISLWHAFAYVPTWSGSYVIDDGHVFDQSPDSRRQIGVVTASFLIFNRIIGTGIFATPSAILSLTGSVGLALFIWVAGMVISLAGTAVYLEWGTAIPKYVYQDVDAVV